MIITFCGHADFIRTDDIKIKMMNILKTQIGDGSAEIFLGGYGAFDFFAYECCKKYKNTHPNVKLVFITPYLNRVKENPENYDEVVYPPLENVPYRLAILKRNRWMVEKADIIIAYVERESGGAYQSLKHAEKHHKCIINIAQ